MWLERNFAHRRLHYLESGAGNAINSCLWAHSSAIFQSAHPLMMADPFSLIEVLNKKGMLRGMAISGDAMHSVGMRRNQMRQHPACRVHSFVRRAYRIDYCNAHSAPPKIGIVPRITPHASEMHCAGLDCSGGFQPSDPIKKASLQAIKVARWSFHLEESNRITAAAVVAAR